MLEGDDLRPLQPHQRARRGLVRTFQSTRAVRGPERRGQPSRAGAQPPRWNDAALDVLHISPFTPDVRAPGRSGARTVGLPDARERLPTDLSHGQRKLVGVARALVAEPKLVLLDEPAAGLDTARERWCSASGCADCPTRATPCS